MHFQEASSAGPAEEPEGATAKPGFKDSPFFPEHKFPLSAVKDTTYLTVQVLVQQVAFILSDKVFTYSPDKFDLDTELRAWHAANEKNAHAYTTRVLPMDLRMGAGSIILGYLFSNELDLRKRRIPQHIIGSSALLLYLQSSLAQIASAYQVSNPLVIHIAASDYSNRATSGLVTNYASQLAIADDLQLGLICSSSAQDAQHMSLFATLMASILPVVHTYDGLRAAQEITKVNEIITGQQLHKDYSTILEKSASLAEERANDEDRVLELLKAFNSKLGTKYKPFEYYGHANAQTVLVVFGSVEGILATRLAQVTAHKNFRVGVINVRIYRPFLEESFLMELPRSTQRLLVLGQVLDEAAVSDPSVHSKLFSNIFRTVQINGASGNATEVFDIKYATSKNWDLAQMASLLANHEATMRNESELQLQEAGSVEKSSKQFTIWNIQSSGKDEGAFIISHILAQNPQLNLSIRSRHDNLIQGGTTRTDIQVSDLPCTTTQASVASDGAFVMDEKLLNEFDIVHGLQTRGFLVLNLPNCQINDVEKRLTVGVRKALAVKALNLYILDPQASKDLKDLKDAESLQSLLLQLSFFQTIEGHISPATLRGLIDANGEKEHIQSLLSELKAMLVQYTVPPSWGVIEPEVEEISLPTDVSVNDFSQFERVDPEPHSSLQNWKTAAKGLLFKETYATDVSLRPDLGFKTFVVHVKERRRLTPLSYDRNIFHIEFDLGDSGLTYAIGEALGIHAHNNEKDVDDFIHWYGLDATEIVLIPTKEDRSVMESRTVHQALVQNVDIFGRPPKRFYEALADYATDEKEKQDLLTLSTPIGATEFQRRAEVDTVTFADILQEFPSAHPSFNDLIRIVNPMKRREYSIASSQRVTPNSVSLLIVTVGWIDSKKRSRFGQATRYLNDLVPGAAVTVSVKPSVMKLPQKSSAPIIMAGLGTGLAPFRAFVQEKALQKQQGEDIGSVLLYMGSRHQREEYLYGEEWEAYERSGVITLLGCAFSRDQPRKIYIQDRMRQSLDDIRQAYLKEEGSFYLCGPTWPVPDVTEVLQEAIEKDAKMSSRKVDSRKEIEQLKEDQRYILEVY